MVNLLVRMRALLRNDEGQDLIEYALIAGLISIVAVVAIGDAGTKINQVWQSVVSALNQVP
jgi:pilus assembly protein Flp/PilA